MDVVHPFEERHFFEDPDLFFEQMGMPRMAGRTLGVLLVENGLIECVASPLPRRDYYRFKFLL